MEVNGKDFMRNVGLEQDKERLIDEQNKLESLKRDSVKREENNLNNNAQDNESAYVDLSINNDHPAQEHENVINDLRLKPEDPNKNKKRYIVLGIGLILLFIITILVIRLISNNDIEDKMENRNPQINELGRDKILDKIDTNEEYQKVIDKKVALEESNMLEAKEKAKINVIDVPSETLENTPIVIDTPKLDEKPKRDLFGLDKTNKIEKEEKVVEIKQKIVSPIEKIVEVKPKVVVKPKVEKTPKKTGQPKRKILVKSPAETNFAKKTSNISGYFIQLGAFTKKPSDKLLNSITKKGYDYTVHTMSIKGKIYNKVLIGSYKTRTNASKVLSKVRKDFNNKNAYILKF